jgi:two-component system nitrate/nitrite response regulator NarL
MRQERGPRPHYLVADDNVAFGGALARALGTYGDATTVRNAREALEAVHARAYAALFVDICLPDCHAFELLAIFRGMNPKAPAMVLTESWDDGEGDRARALKALYVLKPVEPEAIVAFVGLSALDVDERAAHRDRLTSGVIKTAGSFPSTTSWQSGPSPQGELPCRPNDLTPAEREVHRLMAIGMPNWVIARSLFVSVETVKTHVSHILSKLGVHSRREVIVGSRRR